MSDAPEFELIYGALAEISDRLEKINKNLEKLNQAINAYLASKLLRGR
ncbi:MAG: hypothetical protein ACTSUS_03625 [Candidatus Freyarchaeota archaeon]